jgi:GNAT superfamily N-acetyltransferase
MSQTPEERVKVSYLELTSAPAPPPAIPRAERIAQETMARAAYLALYRRVGAPLRWDTRLKLADAELDRLLSGKRLCIYVLRDSSDEAAGFCEFDRETFPDVELKHFGLVPGMQGRGLGPWLLSTALCKEWQAGARRIWLHTDTWDHPAAVPVYVRAGFRVYHVCYQAVDAL